MPKQDEKSEKGSQWAAWQLQLLDQGYDASTVQTMARYRNQDKIDYDLIAHVVKHIVENGTVRIDNNAQPAILVFMPGKVFIPFFFCFVLVIYWVGREEMEKTYKDETLSSSPPPHPWKREG